MATWIGPLGEQESAPDPRKMNPDGHIIRLGGPPMPDDNDPQAAGAATEAVGSLIPSRSGSGDPQWEGDSPDQRRWAADRNRAWAWGHDLRVGDELNIAVNGAPVGGGLTVDQPLGSYPPAATPRWWRIQCFGVNSQGDVQSARLAVPVDTYLVNKLNGLRVHLPLYEDEQGPFMHVAIVPGAWYMARFPR